MLNATIGASGAIFGLMAAYVVIQRKRGADMSQLLVLIAINLVIGFLPGSGISWQAHLGGLVGGAVIGAILVSTRGRDWKRRQNWLLAGFTLVLVAIAFSHAPFIVGI
jgi:membrane associated rhomboid family serine protease